MKQITEITDDPRQTTRIVLDDGTSFDLDLSYSSQQTGWYIERLEYQNFILRHLRITNSANILRQYKNKIPFGLASVNKNGNEPFALEDFSSGETRLLILNEKEVEEFEELLNAKDQ